MIPITDRTIQTRLKDSARFAEYRMQLQAQIGGYEFDYTGLQDDYEPEGDQRYHHGETNRVLDHDPEMGCVGAGMRLSPRGL